MYHIDMLPYNLKGFIDRQQSSIRRLGIENLNIVYKIIYHVILLYIIKFNEFNTKIYSGFYLL